MNIFLQILFWTPLILIIHSYVFFPLILKKLAQKKQKNQIIYKESEQTPFVSVVMAVFNEQKVIEKKIISVFNTKYPIENIEFIIGSDCSTDNTDNIILQLCSKFPQIKFSRFEKRTGKITIINELVKKANGDIIISTDAKAIFLEDTIYNLVKHFKNQNISIVGGILINEKFDANGISHQEDFYMNREMEIKYNEGLIWNSVIGIYGALYAIRKNEFPIVPLNFLVDDFYITFKILERKKNVIIENEAKAIENLPNTISEEFKRKVRIATGNFQNLRKFFKFILKPYTGVGFSFISHKAIRWTTPLLIIISIIANIFLLKYIFYIITLIGFISLTIIPILDYILKQLKINIKLLRLITHFLAMNLALLLGFLKSLKGVKSSIWQPSKR